MRRLMVPLLVLLLGLGAGPAAAFEGKPKLGPDAVPITRSSQYLRAAPAPDYWKLSAFYVPQFTSSACSVASAAMAVIPSEVRRFAMSQSSDRVGTRTMQRNPMCAMPVSIICGVRAAGR